MALSIWNQSSGYSLGVYPESTRQEIALPVSSVAGITFKVISGELPPGYRLISSTGSIIGTAYQVPADTVFTFCIRASNGVEIADRTFNITVTGNSNPIFVTPAGPLAIENPTQYFVLDSSFVYFQLEAIDEFVPATNKINFFIASGDGELPPGLTLSKSGLIYGLVEPALSIIPADGDGSYDNTYYDKVAFDFGNRPSNGFDSYIYDVVTYDYSLKANAPKKLNRNYGFTVTITDGYNTARRSFSIFVVGDDYFRADNDNLHSGTGIFTADNTYLRAPIWLTKSDLGTYRANNYVTLIIDTYDVDEVIYNLDSVNADLTAITKKVSSTDNVANSYNITIKEPSSVPLYAQWLTFDNLVNGAYINHHISNVQSLGNNTYRLTLTTPLEVDIPDDVQFNIGSLSTLPPGMSFDRNTAEVFGTVPYQPAITKEYSFTITASHLSNHNEFARSSRKFTIRIIGEIESFITWNTDGDLGSVNANFISTLKVEAVSSIPTATILYTLIGGRLPPGLSLNLDGEIIGKVSQYPTLYGPGLTSIDNLTEITTFDGGDTTYDRVYTFTVQAQDQLVYSATTKSFTISVDTPNELVFSNIITKPFLKSDQRVTWKSFINDTTVFTPQSIYRPNDPNFGLQTELKMLVYAGLETTEAARYISAMGLNHKKKRFQFGNVKKATAVVPGTHNEVYEVVYVEMIDPLEPNKKKLPNSIIYSPQSDNITTDRDNEFWQPGFSPKTDPDGRVRMGRDGLNTGRPDPVLTTDIEGYQISNSKPGTYFPNSVSIWRDRLKHWSDIDPLDPTKTVSFANERLYLPLWMRSIQPGGNQELDFQLAVPLCFCKVGAADDIILNIKFSGFDFKLIDYTVDRYIIDAVKGETADKYLVFKNDRITV